MKNRKKISVFSVISMTILIMLKKNKIGGNS